MVLKGYLHRIKDYASFTAENPLQVMLKYLVIEYSKKVVIRNTLDRKKVSNSPNFGIFYI